MHRPMRAPAGFTENASSPDGLVTYSRKGLNVSLKLNYRDPPRSVTLRERSREEVTRAVDQLRDEAVAAMRGILDHLRKDLVGKLPDSGRNDFPDDPVYTGGHPFITPEPLRGNVLAVTFPPYKVTVQGSDPRGSSDRVLTEEFIRTIERRRTEELLAAFETVRRDLAEDLGV